MYPKDKTSKAEQPGTSNAVPDISKALRNTTPCDDEYGTARSKGSSVSDSSRSSGSERGRRKPPKSVKSRKSGDLNDTFTKEDPIAADIRSQNTNGNNHEGTQKEPKEKEEEEEGESPPRSMKEEEKGTGGTTEGEGGEDTLKAMTDEMEKVLGDTKKGKWEMFRGVEDGLFVIAELSTSETSAT